MSALNYLKISFTFLLLLSITSNSFSQNHGVLIEQDSLIPQLLEKKIDMSNKNTFGDRFKIQLYYGNNQEASNYVTRFRSLFTTYSSEVIYETPNYKVWVGNFKNKIEADRALMKIKKEFSSAFIFKPERG